ncbi:unnamed protein product [Mytilus coruscus]|uniref:Peptidase A2 domain-containing protein n=1 Tax=Mytilus coruscus TaxID=42192 RepID=A0A6J8CQK3_MYTCO|nr:unnamed protein product [Mytilus coruscus]
MPKMWKSTISPKRKCPAKGKNVTSAQISDTLQNLAKPGNSREIDFKIDTGADVTVISDSDLNGINSIELMKANKRLSGPGNTNLNVVGKFQCMLETKDKFSVQDIYVVKGLSKPLLGRPAIQALGIIDKVNVSSVNASSEANNYYRGKYPKIFNGLGKTKWTYTIALGPDAKPFALSTPRRVPLPLMDKVKG